VVVGAGEHPSPAVVVGALFHAKHHGFGRHRTVNAALHYFVALPLLWRSGHVGRQQATFAASRQQAAHAGWA
jgi:hypothetical protein